MSRPPSFGTSILSGVTMPAGTLTQAHIYPSLADDWEWWAKFKHENPDLDLPANCALVDNMTLAPSEYPTGYMVEYDDVGFTGSPHVLTGVHTSIHKMFTERLWMPFREWDADPSVVRQLYLLEPGKVLDWDGEEKWVGSEVLARLYRLPRGSYRDLNRNLDDPSALRAIVLPPMQHLASYAEAAEYLYNERKALREEQKQ